MFTVLILESHQVIKHKGNMKKYVTAAFSTVKSYSFSITLHSRFYFLKNRLLTGRENLTVELVVPLMYLWVAVQTQSNVSMFFFLFLDI